VDAQGDTAIDNQVFVELAVDDAPTPVHPAANADAVHSADGVVVHSQTQGLTDIYADQAVVEVIADDFIPLARSGDDNAGVIGHISPDDVKVAASADNAAKAQDVAITTQDQRVDARLSIFEAPSLPVASRKQMQRGDQGDPSEIVPGSLSWHHHGQADGEPGLSCKYVLISV